MRLDPEEDSDAGVFDIYETQDGPRTVGNPVRRRILARMAGRELTVPEMIAVTRLTKSTLSTHLALLYKERFVGYREDPTDRRKKRYYLISRRICSGRPHDPASVPASDGPAALGVAGGVPKALLRSLIAELRGAGLDLQPVLRETGRRVGELAGRSEAAEGAQGWADRASTFWEENGLGRLEIVEDGTDPIVTVRECRLCCEGPGATHMMCTLTAGLLEGMASETFRTAIEAIEEGQEKGTDGCGCTFRLRAWRPAAEV